MGYVLFGAGLYGQEAVKRIEKEKIEFFLDNKKSGITEDGIPIVRFDDYMGTGRRDCIVITVSSQYQSEIEEQLKQNGYDYITCEELYVSIIKEKIQKRTDYIGVYNRTISWINAHSIRGEGIMVSSDVPISYPEVTGYYIPTLLRWGYRDLAVQYANWLISIQQPNGSWYDAHGQAPYIFDSAQILKGLIAIRGIAPEADDAIVRGCDWVLSCMDGNGRLITPDKDAWGNDKSFCDEIIHIYCLSPIIEAGRIFNRPEYTEKANQIWKYYKNEYHDKIMHFSLLSHFYAYLMEALLDLGEVEMARTAMGKMINYQKDNGEIPALNHVDWVCSTGLFQLALVWYRLGDIEHGNRSFEYACKLQNESGGWYGSYLSVSNPKEENYYFPNGEISWACKYFLDALYYKNYAEFNQINEVFLTSIDDKDGRFTCVRNIVKESGNNKSVLDVGCGKGRYIKKLVDEIPGNMYCAVDLSPRVMEHIDDARIECSQGTLTCIPYANDSFDVTYACESLEHAIDINSSIREMVRVTKSGGKIVVIDKNKEELGRFEIGPWEQWFDKEELKNIMLQYCSNVKVQTEVEYEGKTSDGLFFVWVGTVK